MTIWCSSHAMLNVEHCILISIQSDYTAIDTSCTGTLMEPMLTNNTEGLVELCDGMFRNGLAML